MRWPSVAPRLVGPRPTSPGNPAVFGRPSAATPTPTQPLPPAGSPPRPPTMAAALLPAARPVAARRAPGPARATSEAAPPPAQKIRIKLKSFDTARLVESADLVVEAAKSSGASVSGPVPLPTRCVKRGRAGVWGVWGAGGRGWGWSGPWRRRWAWAQGGMCRRPRPRRRWRAAAAGWSAQEPCGPFRRSCQRCISRPACCIASVCPPWDGAGRRAPRRTPSGTCASPSMPSQAPAFHPQSHLPFTP